MTGLLLDLLLAVALAIVGLMFIQGRHPLAGSLAAVLYGLQGLLLVGMGASLMGDGVPVVPSALRFEVLGHAVHWEMGGLGYLFAVLTVGTALFVAISQAGAWGTAQGAAALRRQHGALALNVFAMLLLLSSADFLSLFIGWEMTSWSGALMMVEGSRRATFRSILYATGGTMALLAAIVLVDVRVGGLDFAALRTMAPHPSAGTLWALVLLLMTGFGVKMALMPFHLWQAEAYAATPGPSSAFLGAVSARMGLFAVALVLGQGIGLAALSGVFIPLTPVRGQTVLLGLAALTVVVPTFIALMQTDARLLLAWHGIGQGGYMVLGVLLGTPLGVAGGLLHAVNYASTQAALFLVVTVVVHRTGTADLDRLGGLITRLPWSFVGLLLGIIALADLPPLNGFVSKWLIYKALLEAGRPLVLMATFIGTLGTILSVYKLIHNIFLGQLRQEHAEVREGPVSVMVPMLILAGLGGVTGTMPGLVLDLVDRAQRSLGIAPLPHHLGGVPLATGGLDMIRVNGALVVAIGLGAVIFLAGPRSRRVHPLDNYAGGHFLSAEMRYHYSHDFYPGVARVIMPWFRGAVVAVERGVVSFARVAGDGWLGLYRRAYTPILMVAFAVFALLWFYT